MLNANKRKVYSMEKFPQPSKRQTTTHYEDEAEESMSDDTSTFSQMYLVSAGFDATVKLFSVKESVELVQSYASTLSRSLAVKKIILVEEDAMIISGGLDRRITFWKITNENSTVEYPVRSINVDMNISDMLLYYNPLMQKHFIFVCGSASSNFDILLIDYETGIIVSRLKGHTGIVEKMALVSGKVPLLFSCSGDKTCRMWNLLNGKCENVFQGHDDYVYAICALQDINVFVSASNNNLVKFWNFSPPVMSVKKTMTTRAHASNAGSSEQLNTSSFSNNSMTVVDEEFGPYQCINTISTKFAILSMQSHPTQHHLLLTASSDACIYFWNVMNPALVSFPIMSITNPFHCALQSVSVIVHSDEKNPIPKEIVSAGDVNGNLVVWDLKTKEVIHEVEGAHINWISTMQLSGARLRKSNSNLENYAKSFLLVFDSCIFSDCLVETQMRNAV